MERIHMRLSPPQQAFVAPCSFCTAAFFPVLELGKSSGVFGEASQLLVFHNCNTALAERGFKYWQLLMKTFPTK